MMHTMGRGRALKMRLIGTMVSLVLVLPQVLRADPFLGRLDCVSIQASVLEVGGSFGVTVEVLRDALRAGLSTHVPHLKIEPSCPDRIVYKVFLQHFSTGQFEGFSVMSPSMSHGRPFFGIPLSFLPLRHGMKNPICRARKTRRRPVCWIN